MAFDYYLLVDDDDGDHVVGLFAVNRDQEAGRLDTMLYSHLRQRWVSDPSAVTQYLFGQDYVERAPADLESRGRRGGRRLRHLGADRR